MERVVIVGAPGGGKSTLATQLGERLGLPVFERDALGKLGSVAYRSEVERIVNRDTWIFDGFPYYVDDRVYQSADTVIALDYAKTVVLFRVLRRSVALAFGRREQGAHQANGVRSWAASDHAVRVAWTKHADRRKETRALAARPELREKQVILLSSPAETQKWLTGLGI